MERVGELVYCFLKHQGQRIDKLQIADDIQPVQYLQQEAQLEFLLLKYNFNCYWAKLEAEDLVLCSFGMSSKAKVLTLHRVLRTGKVLKMSIAYTYLHRRHGSTGTKFLIGTRLAH